jgi:hypothetical protein
MSKLWSALAVALISVPSYAAAATGNELNRSFNPPSTRTVSGTRIIHYKNGPVPVDLSQRTIAALIPSGSGGYNVLPGTGTSSGTFSIPNVPAGSYLLQIGANYVWTSQTVVDVDSILDFRSDTVQADPSTTSITFDLTNLHAWQQTDSFEMVCPNNATFDFFPGTVGETTFTGNFPYAGALSVGTEGDQYYVAQLTTQNLGGFVFDGLARHMAPAKFNQAQGSDTPINGRLKNVTQNQKFEVNINAGDLGAQALAANPSAALNSGFLGLSVYPGSFSKGQNTSTADLVLFSAPPFITTNGDLGKVRYGNPYSSKWARYVGFNWLAQTNYTAPGATSSAPLITFVSVSTLKLPSPTSPMKPLAGVVSKPSINGRNFFTDRIGVGTTPVLKWSAPKVGKANNYLVQIYQLSDNGGNTVISGIATFYTQSRSLTVPQGLMSTGSGYVFVIQSDYIPGVNFAKTPLLNGSTSASAQVASGVMQP